MKGDKLITGIQETRSKTCKCALFKDLQQLKDCETPSPLWPALAQLFHPSKVESKIKHLNIKESWDEGGAAEKGQRSPRFTPTSDQSPQNGRFSRTGKLLSLNQHGKGGKRQRGGSDPEAS